MNIQDRLKILNLHLDNVNSHIAALELGIQESPNGDIEGKQPRAQVLADYFLQKELLQNMILELEENNIPG